MAKGFNGGIIGSRNLTTGGLSGTATGIYSVNEAQLFKLAGLWPQETPVGYYPMLVSYPTSNAWIAPSGTTSVDYLVVAGGAGGGNGRAGGGGAGGFLTGTNFPVTPNTSYSITVGAGGAGSSASGSTAGANGGSGVVVIRYAK